MKKGLTVVAGLAALAATASMAGGPAPSSAPASASSPIPAPGPITAPESGFYLNLNIGGGEFNVDTGPNLGSISVDNSGFIWSANAGYQFNHYVAVEAGYMRLPEYVISGTATFIISGVPVALSANAKVNVNAWILAVKGMWPLSYEVDIFGKGGIAYQTTSGRESLTGGGTVFELDDLGGDTQVAPYFALGVEYMVTLNLYLNAQGFVITPAGDFPTSWGGLVGITYMFA